VAVVAVFHGHTAQDRKVRLYEALDLRVLRRMDRCVCVAHEAAERVRRAGVSDERIQVIHNAVAETDGPRDRAASRALLERLWPVAPRFLIGAAGRLSHEKGFDLLIVALGTVSAQHDAGLILFGEGLLRDPLERLIRAAGLRDRVILAGQRDDLPALLPGLDLLAVPSRTEGLPTVVLEGMAAGVPIVAAAVGGIPEALAGDCGRLVPAERADDLAAAIVEVLARPELAEGYRQRSLESVALHFSADRQAREHHELYAAVAGRRPR
jgi:glycosyltransferase involved in cell wall biosynthesis